MTDKRGDIELDELGKWILVVLAFVLLVIGAFIISGKGEAAIQYIKNFIKFGR
ncbi:hypothetical protein HYW76_01815 [Candidatus Pacearchaeota archaeon]|nr:hypothetical protein [Candidatus Pacearchaeota archaeon]